MNFMKRKSKLSYLQERFKLKTPIDRTIDEQWSDNSFEGSSWGCLKMGGGLHLSSPLSLYRPYPPTPVCSQWFSKLLDQNSIYVQSTILFKTNSNI